MNPVLIIILMLYIMADVNYFIRMVWISSAFLRKKVKFDDTTSIYGIVTTQDVDIFLRHMNNARYLRDIDFAKCHFYVLNDIYSAIRKNGGTMIQGASNIRYRREMRIFTVYRIETKLLWWDEKALYVEHKFITKADNFIAAIIMAKHNVINVNVMDIMQELSENERRPELPEELKLWLESIETSSKNLRAHI